MASKAARWLGHVPFERFEDRKNSEPVERIRANVSPRPFLGVDVDIGIPAAGDLEARVEIADFQGMQPFRLVLFGEKSSLEDVLGAVSDRYHADLYLAEGEISDTLIHRMAARAVVDGRPMVVLTFSDCDPAGWQMPISIARKLQASQALDCPDLDFRLYRVALMPKQVRTYGLPSTPLKKSEKRADRWREAMGVEQTEIDALATLRPEVLTEIAENAIAPFYDPTLGLRVDRARSVWQEQAQAALAEQAGERLLERLREQAEAKLASLRGEIDAINDAMRLSVEDVKLPPIPSVPEPVLDQDPEEEPLIDSRWSYLEQTRRLIRSKAYKE